MPDQFHGLVENTNQETKLSSLSNDKLCTPCIYALFQHLQSTPFSNYNDALADEWSTIQARCSLSHLTQVQQKFISAHRPRFAGPNAKYTKGCRSNKTYHVEKGDTVMSIAGKKSVSTGALILSNGLLRDGSDLKAGQKLCLPEACATYTVKEGDYCFDIALNHDAPYAAFFNWNPMINKRCTNIIPGQSVCVAPPGGAWKSKFKARGKNSENTGNGTASNDLLRRMNSARNGGSPPRHPGSMAQYDAIVSAMQLGTAVL